MRYPETLLIRLPPGTKGRIAALRREGEGLADTQRRVVLAGIDAVADGPETAVVDLLREWNLGADYLRAWADVAARKFPTRGSVIPLVRLLQNMADIEERGHTDGG